jgi:hypothetical protein
VGVRGNGSCRFVVHGCEEGGAASVKAVLRPWLGPTMATPVGVVHLLEGIVDLSVLLSPRCPSYEGNLRSGVGSGDGDVVCAAPLLGGIALEFAPVVCGRTVCWVSVGDFCGSDDGVEQKLGCGDGFGSRSFRRVRWLSRVGFFVVGESESPAQRSDV